MSSSTPSPGGLRSTDTAHGVDPGPVDWANGDWDLLFEAVLARLRHSVADPAAASPALRETVDECLQALTQLRASCTGEIEAARHQLAGMLARERQARHRAQHDELTALPNRGLFQRRIGDALNGHGAAAPAPALAVLFVDLDDFKQINDRHGHDIGDQSLCIVARRLRRAVRARDLVCRLGGDEFACLLADTLGHAQLSRLACQLFDAVSAPMRVGSLQLSVRPSIGIAICPDHGQTAEMLLQHADAAMYQAKRQRLGYAFFEAPGAVSAP